MDEGKPSVAEVFLIRFGMRPGEGTDLGQRVILLLTNDKPAIHGE